MPAADSAYQAAQANTPGSRVVYAGNDPMVLTHARALLTGTPGTTAYLSANLREPAKILPDATTVLFRRP